MTRMKKVYDMHHLLPRSRGGTNDKSNLSRVPQDKHRMWHGLWRNKLPPEIAKEMNEHWISKEWLMVAFKKTRNKRKKRRIIYDCDDFQVILKDKA